jgi:hypothetical protein
MQPYKRYRVSAQRMSPRPRNVEFVLWIDPATAGSPNDVRTIQAAIHAALHNSRSGE